MTPNCVFGFWTTETSPKPRSSFRQGPLVNYGIAGTHPDFRNFRNISRPAYKLHLVLIRSSVVCVLNQQKYGLLVFFAVLRFKVHQISLFSVWKSTDKPRLTFRKLLHQSNLSHYTVSARWFLAFVFVSVTLLSLHCQGSYLSSMRRLPLAA